MKSQIGASASTRAWAFCGLGLAFVVANELWYRHKILQSLRGLDHNMVYPAMKLEIDEDLDDDECCCAQCMGEDTPRLTMVGRRHAAWDWKVSVQ